jgi:hypothetical protein
VLINSIVNLSAVSKISFHRQVISGHLRVSFRLIIDRKVVCARTHRHLVDSIGNCEGNNSHILYSTKNCINSSKERICPYKTE